MSIADSITEAKPVPGALPGSPEWRTRCTASKIAPILGLSRWQTRYEVWHDLAGHTPEAPAEPTYPMLRGTHLEPGIIALWHALNPNWEVEETGNWQSLSRPWLYARPDALARDPEGRAWCLEVKTASSWSEWGPDGTSKVPTEYHCQTVCQRAVTGLPVLLVVLGPGFEMRTYVRDPDLWVVDVMLDEVRAFLDTLPGGPDEREPEPGATDEETVLAATPVYRGWKRDLPDDDPDALALARARVDVDDALAREQACRMVLLLRMEEAESLRWRGRNLMSRKTDGGVFVATADTLRKELP